MLAITVGAFIAEVESRHTPVMSWNRLSSYVRACPNTATPGLFFRFFFFSL